MKKIVLGIAAAILVCVVLGVVVFALCLDRIVKTGVETVGPQITKTDVKLDGARISVLSGSGALKGFLLGNPEGYKTPSAMKVGDVGLAVVPRSVFSDKVHVNYVHVNGAEITFEGTLGTKNNLNKILENVQSVSGGQDQGAGQPPPKPAETKPAESKPPSQATPSEKATSRKLQVDDFLISGAKVNVSMTMLAGKSLTVPIPDIHLTNLGSGPDGITPAELTKQVLEQVIPAVVKAVEAGVADLGKLGKDTINNLSKDGQGTLDKANKSIGNLLQKK